jgi:hypothetical protein
MFWFIRKVISFFYQIIKTVAGFFSFLIQMGSLFVLLLSILIIAVPQTIREHILYPSKKKK